MSYPLLLWLIASSSPVVALSGDGRLLAVAEATLIRIRVVGGDTPPRTIPVPSVKAIALSSTGKSLAVAAGPVIYLFDTANGKSLGKLTGHGAAVQAVAFFPDGKRVVSGAADGQARLWNLSTLRATRAIQIDEGGISAISVSPEGTLFAAATREGAQLFDTTSGFRLSFLHPQARVERPAYVVAFSPDGQTLAASHQGGCVCLYEVRSGQMRGVQKGSGDAVRQLAFASNGRILAYPSKTGMVRRWQLIDDQVHEIESSDTVLSVASGGVVDMPPARMGPPPSQKPDDAWQSLDDSDAVKAYRAMWSLALTMDGVELLVRQMKDVKAQLQAHRDEVCRLIKALDADSFAEREKATLKLARMGQDVYDELHRALKAKPAPEPRRRLERLLRDMKAPTNPLPVGLLRRLRAVEALEMAGTPDARSVIERLTTTDEERLRTAAQSAQRRMIK